MLKTKAYKFLPKVRKFQLPTVYSFSTAEGETRLWVDSAPPSGLNRVKPHFASQTSWLHFELLPWQQNYRRYLAGFVPKISEKSAICKDIEIKFDIDTKFGPLSS